MAIQPIWQAITHCNHSSAATSSDRPYDAEYALEGCQVRVSRVNLVSAISARCFPPPESLRGGFAPFSRG